MMQVINQNPVQQNFQGFNLLRNLQKESEQNTE